MQPYDLIGDIHGQANELIKLLEKMSYVKNDGIWQHHNRKVIFLGDFIDRGAQQREVIDIVRPMVENGFALSVMGNHEYNAIAYFTENGKGGHYREHNEKNFNQHKAFLSAYEGNPEEYKDVIEWFKSLPLWLDLEGLRVVHACWDIDLVNRIGKSLDNGVLHKSSDKSTVESRAIETLLKGKEIPLPNGQFFYDKDKNPRNHIRIKFWERNAKTYKDLFMGPKDALKYIPDLALEDDYSVPYPADEKPLFLGHYWMEGEIKPLAENIACIDYSVAKPGGKLVAYRWDGEEKIDASKFVSVRRSKSNDSSNLSEFNLFNWSDVSDFVDWEGRPAVVVDEADGSRSAWVVPRAAEPGAWEPASGADIFDSGVLVSKAEFQEIFEDRLAKG